MPEFNAAQQERKLSRRLFVALATPLTILLAMATVLGLQLSRLNRDARWVDHSDEVVAKLLDVQRQIIDQETGVRGFLLKGDPVFLEPYRSAHPLEALTELRLLVADNRTQVAHVDALRARYQSWHEGVTPFITDHARAGPAMIDSLLERKVQMDGVRTAIAMMLDAENALRRERKLASAQSVQRTWVLLVVLFALAASALALLSVRQLSAVAKSYGQLLLDALRARSVVEAEAWLQAGQAQLAAQAQGELTIEQLSERVLRTLGEYVQAEVGAFFIEIPLGWSRCAGFGLTGQSGEGALFAKGEGLVGRAAASCELIHLKELPPAYLHVRSGTGAHLPVEVVLLPARTEKQLWAVLELGFLRPVPPRVLDLLRRVSEALAIAVRSCAHKDRLRELLEESQRQTEELQSQQEELRAINEELAEQTSALHAANARTAERQQQLEQANRRLEQQKGELQSAQQLLLDKAAEAERVSRYKSEFLAKMSHELRTPLNSSLILARLLADNRDGNLTAEQVRFAETIHAAGNDLLALINDILDLSKIEAGKAELHPAPVHLLRLCQTLAATFEPIARERQLAFTITQDPGVPPTFETDPKWLQQILRNLLSNAIKFTPKGEVALRISASATSLYFAIRDSGIGIAPHKQELVFEAFRQVDGASNRKYGGTGLGLSISRDLTRLLGGELTLQSELGVGSTFTLCVPRVAPASAATPKTAPSAPLLGAGRELTPSPLIPAPLPRPSAEPPAPARPAFADDRDHLDRQRQLVLLIEDDVHFARILRDVAPERLLDEVTLFLHQVEAELPPAHQRMLSQVRSREAVFEGRKILIVEDDVRSIFAVTSLLEPRGAAVVIARNGRAALEVLERTGDISLVLMDIMMPEMDGITATREIRKNPSWAKLPIIALTAKAMTDDQERCRQAGASDYIAKPLNVERLLSLLRVWLPK